MNKLLYLIFSIILISNIFCNKTFRIITPDSPGLINDAKIYNNLIPNSYIVYGHNDITENNKKVDINLFLEWVIGDKKIYPANESWLMVNQELLDPKALDIADRFICKSRYAQKLLEKKLKNKNKIIYYTKHTSRDLLEKQEIIPQKDYNLFVHFAGKSFLKNTDKVIQAWINNDGFGRYDYPKLIITIYDIGIIFNPNLKKILKDFIKVEDHLEHKKYKNILIYNFMKFEDLQELQKKAGIFICPSSCEGFGHYINEGRSTGSIIITTDGPPMNELVNNENGILIKPSKIVNSRQVILCQSIKGSKAFIISPENIAKAIDKYYKLDLNQKIKMGLKSRELYLEDKYFFIKNVNNIFK